MAVDINTNDNGYIVENEGDEKVKSRKGDGLTCTHICKCSQWGNHYILRPEESLFIRPFQ